MEKHYAIVKCDRYQETWSFAKRDWDYSRHGDSFWSTIYQEEFDKLKNKEYYPYINRTRQTKELLIKKILDTEKNWEEDVCVQSYSFHKEFSFGIETVKNGVCTLWEGEVHLSLLREGDNLYIPILEKYLCINRVELNPDGEIIYYVDYIKVFYETSEQDRVKAVDNFINEMYGDIQNFEEMKQYRYDRNSHIEFFEKTTQEVNLFIKNLSSEKFLATIGLSEEANNNKKQPKKEEILENNTDKQWEKTSMFVLLGGIVVLTLLFLIGLG